MPTDTESWIRRFHPVPDAATRLLCLPHAGGSASYYFPVSRALSTAATGPVDVLAVQYPGRQDRRAEPCIDDIRVLAEHVVAAIQPFLDRPLAIFGHSMGGLVGFEVALRLEAAGVEPTCLFASGRRAPSRRRDEKVHTLSDDGVIAEITSLGGSEAGLLADPEMRAMVLPAVRADYRAVETYRYQGGPPLRCPVRALNGDADPQVTSDEAGDWVNHTTGGFTSRVFPGDHFYLNRHAAAVIAEIADHAARPHVPAG
jgi:pyochelin biosynthesis protein PchC